MCENELQHEWSWIVWSSEVKMMKNVYSVFDQRTLIHQRGRTLTHFYGPRAA